MLLPISPLLSRSGGEKGPRGSGARTLGVPLGGTRRVGGLLGETPLYLPGDLYLLPPSFLLCITP